MRSSRRIPVYLETGERRTFAGAIDWPGWCRSGRDEAEALAALLEAAPRFARALRAARLGFRVPAGTVDLAINERLVGNATTDFGAPDRAPSSDAGRIGEAELRRLQTILRACWRAFDAAASAAKGNALRQGPRGGGRHLEGILQHVLDAESAYLSRLGRSYKVRGGDLHENLLRIRPAVLEALASAAAGGTPARGPRGGVRWGPRYFVRRVAWHVLDHTWEIEDRMM